MTAELLEQELQDTYQNQQQAASVQLPGRAVQEPVRALASLVITITWFSFRTCHHLLSVFHWAFLPGFFQPNFSNQQIASSLIPPWTPCITF